MNQLFLIINSYARSACMKTTICINKRILSPRIISHNSNSNVFTLDCCEHFSIYLAESSHSFDGFFDLIFARHCLTVTHRNIFAVQQFGCNCICRMLPANTVAAIQSVWLHLCWMPAAND